MAKRFKLLSTSDEKGMVEPAAVALFDALTLGSLATVNADGTPHVNACYFAPSQESGREWKLYFISSPKSAHIKNLVRRPSCAIAGFETTQRFGTELRGLQLFGAVRPLSLIESVPAFTLYAKRFPDLLRWAASAQAWFDHFEDRFFEFALTHGKLLDEPTFGKEVYLDFSIETTA